MCDWESSPLPLTPHTHMSPSHPLLASGKVTPKPLVGQNSFQKTTPEGAGRTSLIHQYGADTTQKVSNFCLILRSQMKGIFPVSLPITCDTCAF